MPLLICEDNGRDPSTLQIHGRALLGGDLQRDISEGLELGFSRMTLAFDRFANPGCSHAEHLDAYLAAKPLVDSVLG